MMSMDSALLTLTFLAHSLSRFACVCERLQVCTVLPFSYFLAALHRPSFALLCLPAHTQKPFTIPTLSLQNLSTFVSHFFEHKYTQTILLLAVVFVEQHACQHCREKLLSF